ncbi:MAG: hypothetical protein ACKOWF_03695 [Chloroflexota bacterium]
MAAPKLERRWTCQDLLDLPDDGVRRKIIDGELHQMTGADWARQIALQRLVTLLHPFARWGDSSTPLPGMSFSPAPVRSNRTSSWCRPAAPADAHVARSRARQIS